MTNEELYHLPASELLKHIQVEKERLIKEKIIRKSKPLPPITEDEKPYELPKGWEWVRLGEIGDWGAGATPLRSRSDYYINGSVPWLKTGELNDGYITKCEEYITELALKETSVRFNKPGDILIAMYGATIGKLGILKIAATTNQACCACSVFSGINNKFLFYFLLSMRETFKGMSEGGAQPNISKDKISRTIFPLPPLYIQDQIVQQLEQLSVTKDSLLSHAESQLNYTKKMREALLQKAIRGELVPQDENDEPASILLEKIKVEKEDLRLSKNARKESAFPQIEDHEIPFEIPSHWKWIRLGEIGIYKKGPFGSALKKSLFVPKGEDTVKVFEQKNAIQKNITLGDYYISKDYFETSMTGFEVFPGDILVSCAGTIGETYVVPENSEKGIINQALMKMNIVKSVDVNYFLYYFDFILKNTARESSKGSAIKNIPPFDVFKRLLIPIPPLAEQERIVAKLDELMANCDQLEAKAEEMKKYTTNLFEAGLKEAFMNE